jgi:hypothetical protein
MIVDTRPVADVDVGSCASMLMGIGACEAVVACASAPRAAWRGAARLVPCAPQRSRAATRASQQDEARSASQEPTARGSAAALVLALQAHARCGLVIALRKRYDVLDIHPVMVTALDHLARRTPS